MERARRGSSAANLEGGIEITFEELLEHVRRIRSCSRPWPYARATWSGRLPNVWQYVALELAIPDLGAVSCRCAITGRARGPLVLEKTRPRLVITGDDIGAAARACRASRSRAGSIADRGDRHELGHDRHAKLASLSARLKQMTFESFTSRLGITERTVSCDDTVDQGIGGMCLYCMRLGAPLVMLREPHWTAEHCLETAAAARATVMVGVPTNVIRMLNQPISLPTVRAVAVAEPHCPGDRPALGELDRDPNL